ncbi:hypothetical protein Pcinc_044444 [Petrolisthes cinctipes]|uniref:Vitelline membrane outer layer protein 1 n=1 Tax=Petrolisthes cinctipes TaxID=88211 RepID=A0AAE1BGQ1_PETCI|nr:hypothetical protein Pcinc_044444 [Petrolisthes cinctipes]
MTTTPPTPLLLLLLLLPLAHTFADGSGYVRGVTGSIPTTNGLNRGDWGNIDLCPSGSYAFGLEIKYSGLGFVDDTSVNAIMLYCKSLTGSLTGTIISSEGEYGQWQGLRSCPTNKYLNGMRANVVPDQGTFGDDLGVDNIQMTCNDSTILDGLNGAKESNAKQVEVHHEEQIPDRVVEFLHLKIDGKPSARDYGEWGSWGSCSSGNLVCGLQTRFERESTITDDAAITDVIMFCCD